MYRGLGAAALLAITFAMPIQDAAAQDPVGGAILGGAAGAILGGALGGGRGAAAGAIIGGSTGAIIGAQGQQRPGGYYYYQNGCYQPRGDGTYIAVPPEYCAPAAPVAAPPPPPVARPVARGDELRLGIIIGENRERRAQWRREHPEVFFYER
jgi:hypothetical protein